MPGGHPCTVCYDHFLHSRESLSHLIRQPRRAPLNLVKHYPMMHHLVLHAQFGIKPLLKFIVVHIINHNPCTTQNHCCYFLNTITDAKYSVSTTPYLPSPSVPFFFHLQDEETKALQKSIITARQKIHEANTVAVKAMWGYEDAIKRPYFHVKPLEKSQLQAWRNYLDYEMKQGDGARVRVLFERCLIACAFYEEFWMRVSIRGSSLLSSFYLCICLICVFVMRFYSFFHFQVPELHTCRCWD